MIDRRSVSEIAKTAHEVNRAFCAGLGDDSHLPWLEAPQWQRSSAMNGVFAIRQGKVSGPQQSHENWMAEKVREGWTYGPTKDPHKKTHPCLVPYAQLSVEDRAKDILFHTVVIALLERVKPPMVQPKVEPTVSDEPGVAVPLIDEQLDDLLRTPGMHAINLAGVESSAWALLVLRGQLHPDPAARVEPSKVVRRIYGQLKGMVGVTGSGVVAACIGDGAPEAHPAAMNFYRRWIEQVRLRQDSPARRLSPGEQRDILRLMEAKEHVRELQGRPLVDYLRDHFAAEDAAVAELVDAARALIRERPYGFGVHPSSYVRLRKSLEPFVTDTSEGDTHGD